MMCRVCHKGLPHIREELFPYKSLSHKVYQDFSTLLSRSHGVRALPERFAVGRKFATKVCRKNGGAGDKFLGRKNDAYVVLAAHLSDKNGKPL
jgi:hypothetical protein